MPFLNWLLMLDLLTVELDYKGVYILNFLNFRSTYKGKCILRGYKFNKNCLHWEKGICFFFVSFPTSKLGSTSSRFGQQHVSILTKNGTSLSPDRKSVISPNPCNELSFKLKATFSSIPGTSQKMAYVLMDGWLIELTITF